MLDERREEFLCGVYMERVCFAVKHTQIKRERVRTFQSHIKVIITVNYFFIGMCFFLFLSLSILLLLFFLLLFYCCRYTFKMNHITTSAIECVLRLHRFVLYFTIKDDSEFKKIFFLLR